MSTRPIYRNLSAAEIEVLTAHGCAASDWGGVWVHPELDLNAIRDVEFAGCVRIGAGCRIRRVGLIENYDICDGATLRDVGKLSCSLDTTFGNGEAVPVLIESGGREVIMHDQLTAGEAYVMAMYRYRPELIATLTERIARRTAGLRGQCGCIGRGAVVERSRELRNVRIGDGAVIDGVNLLDNGTVLASATVRTTLRNGVTARDFIVREGATVEDGALLRRCFVGQCVTIGAGFTATDSLFFANSHFENGEACSLFAGPFSVSHHKATLLIAGMVSFFNAGSGSNQSNHSYKLGPDKYGILERGAKLASASYLYWPMRVGAFSTVVGHHTLHSDLSALPFSYIIADHERTVIIPAAALESVGTIRDADKWPRRDHRRDYGTALLGADGTEGDRVTFSLFNPYIAARLETAITTLRSLQAAPDKAVAGSDAGLRPERRYFPYQGAYIPAEAIADYIDTYEKALHFYILGAVAESLADRRQPMKDNDSGTGAWCDYGGFIAPQTEVERHWETLSDDDTALFPFTDTQMAAWERNWRLRAVARHFGIHPLEASDRVLQSWMEAWLDSIVIFDLEIRADAEKEFRPDRSILYGADGKAADRSREFEALRGQKETHPFLREWQERHDTLFGIYRRAMGTLNVNH